jgi:hypothetical protein
VRFWAHYERDKNGIPHLLEVSTERVHLADNADPGDWIEEQQWIRFDQENA